MGVHNGDPWEGSSYFVSVLHRKLRIAASFNREEKRTPLFYFTK